MNFNAHLEEVTVEITQQCLQKCLHCSALGSSDSSMHISKEEFETLVNDFVELSASKIQISGGEPLLHQNVFEFIGLSKNAGLDVELFTCGKVQNGGGIHTEDNVLDGLANNTPDKIVFSLEGSNAEKHNAIAVTEGSFNQTISLMGQLIDNGYQIGVHYVPMALNIDELNDLVDFVSDLGVKEISILRFVPQGRGKKNEKILRLHPEEVASLIENLSKLQKRNDISVKIGSHLDFTFLLDNGYPKECMAGKTKCLIEPTGNVIPCAVFKEQPDYIAGNFREDSFQSIWFDSPVFDLFRHFKPDMLKGECARCRYRMKCKGRCPGQRVYDHNDFYMGPDECCPRPYYEESR